MDNKKQTRVIFILCAFLGIVLLCMRGGQNQFHGEQCLRIESNGYELYLFYTFLEENYESEKMVEIEHYLEPATGEYWLFLPRFCGTLAGEKGKVVGYGMNELWIDKYEYIPNIEQNGFFNHILTEGRHTVLVDGQSYILNVAYGGEVNSMFILTGKEDTEYLRQSKEHIDSGYINLYHLNGSVQSKDKIESIHARGNTSFDRAEKKSYTIKTAEKGKYMQGEPLTKKMVLLSNVQDASFLRNKLIYTVAGKIGMDYTPATEYVDVWINGIYEGLYLLSNKIEISEENVNLHNMEEEMEVLNEIPPEEYPKAESKRASGGELKGYTIPNNPQSIEGGYLLEFELDYRYHTEKSGFISQAGQPVVVKNPEAASLEQMNYIADRYQQLENALYQEDGINPETGKSYLEYIDLDSWVKKYLLEEISKNLDFGLTSNYFYKPAGKESVFYAGPVWDYDTSLNVWAERGNIIFFEADELLAQEYEPCDYELIYSLLYRQPAFQKHVKKEYRYVKSVLQKTISNDCVEWDKQIERSMKNNAVRWSMGGYTGGRQTIQTFVEGRLTYLDTIWGE